MMQTGKVGMNDAESITDLAACVMPFEQLYKSAHSLKGYQISLDFHLADGKRVPTGTRN